MSDAKRISPQGLPQRPGHDVYRTISVSGATKLTDLCRIILKAFDFDDEHLFEFCMDNKMYSNDCYQFQPRPGCRSTHIRLEKIRLVEGQKFSLHYDYGDDWMFVINVQEITDVPDIVAANVLKSKGAVEQYPVADDWF